MLTRVLLLLLVLLSSADSTSDPPRPALIRALPVTFEPNVGQAPEEIQFAGHVFQHAIAFGTDSLFLYQANQANNDAIEIKFRNANPQTVLEGSEQIRGKANYFLGNVPDQWRTDVPLFSRLTYHDVYADIDLSYYDAGGELEHDWIVHPGGDPSNIRMGIKGGATRISPEGDLIVNSGEGAEEFVFRKPFAYQSNHVVEVAYLQTGENEFGFALEAYDSDKELIIDPVIVFTRPLTQAESVYGMAADRAGNIVITGSVESFEPLAPSPGAVQTTAGGGTDAYVIKFAPSGEVLLVTYLGGTGQDGGRSIATDPSGNIYITGSTTSNNFPLAGPIQTNYDNGTPDDRMSGDAFVVKLNPEGNAFYYSTYLGGSYLDIGYAIKADDAGNAYVGGLTYSLDFPLSNPYQRTGPYEERFSFGGSGFITKLNPLGSVLVFSTFFQRFGTTNSPNILDLAIDPSGNVYVTGVTDYRAPDVSFILSPPTGNPSLLPYIAKLSSSGSQLVYASFLPGGLHGTAIAVDPTGAACVVILGNVQIGNLPRGELRGNSTLLRVNPTGSALIYNTTITGTVTDIDVDRTGAVYAAAFTSSGDLPSVNAVMQRDTVGSFLMKLGPAGSDVLYSTYVGNVRGVVAVDGDGNAMFASRDVLKIAPAGGDISAPIITNVNISEVTINSAKASWTTDRPSDSLVQYGLTTAYASKSALNKQLTVSHTALITGLTSGTEYHFRATSMGRAGNVAASTDATFRTLTTPIVSGNPVPGLTSIEPNMTPAGGNAITVRLRGTNLIPASVARAGTTNLTTVFVDSTALDAVVSAALLMTPATLEIAIVNPSPGGGVSAALPFRVSGAGIPATGTAPLPIPEVETGSIQTGYIVITPDANSPGPSVTVTYGLVNNALVRSQAGILPATLLTDGTLFVDVVRSAGRNLGVAIANPNATSNSISLTMVNEDGSVAGSPAAIVLAPYQQLARFVDELFPAQDVRTAFRGSLRAQASMPFAMLGLRFAGVQFSTMPVAGTAATSSMPQRTLAGGSGISGGVGSLIFPQFAMSGGWATQVALINNSDNTIGGRVDIFDSNGNPIAVKLNGVSQSRFLYSLAPRTTHNLAPRDANGQSPF